MLCQSCVILRPKICVYPRVHLWLIFLCALVAGNKFQSNAQGGKKLSNISYQFLNIFI
jgi:hypothetical protein